MIFVDCIFKNFYIFAAPITSYTRVITSYSIHYTKLYEQNVQPSSIRKAKQRIRAKLNVESNIEDYLQEYREKQIKDMTK